MKKLIQNIKINHLLIFLSIGLMILSLVNINITIYIFEGTTNIFGLFKEIISNIFNENDKNINEIIFLITSTLVLFIPFFILINIIINKKFKKIVSSLIILSFISIIPFIYYLNEALLKEALLLDIDIITGNKGILLTYISFTILLLIVSFIQFIKYISYYGINILLKLILFIVLVLIVLGSMIFFGSLMGDIGMFIYIATVMFFMYISINEEDYIKKEINKDKNEIEDNIENIVKLEKDKKLTQEDIEELRINEEELELLKKKQELERLRKKEEMNKLINNNIKLIKAVGRKTLIKIESFFIKYAPIIIKNIKKIKKQTLKESKKISSKIINKTRNIDTKKYKSIGSNNIEKVRTIKIPNNIKKYSILLSIIIILVLILNYSYNNYYYNNQIIKVGDNIFLKKEPSFINYFNNKKIKIGFNDEENILSQYLMSARSYKDNTGYINYKVGGYASIYSLNNGVDIENIKEKENDLGIIVEKTEKGKIELITYNENIDEYNLYDIELFKELNGFTNKNTFYSSIVEKYDNSIILNSGIGNNIKKLFQIDELLRNLDNQIRNDISIEGDYKNNILGLEINDNKLTINLKYNYYDLNIIDKDFIKEGIYSILNDINEESIINYSSYNLNIDTNSIVIKAIYKIAKSDLNKILNNKSLNKVEEIDYFTTTINNY